MIGRYNGSRFYGLLSEHRVVDGRSMMIFSLIPLANIFACAYTIYCIVEAHWGKIGALFMVVFKFIRYPFKTILVFLIPDKIDKKSS